jgi:hypothetical protein
MIRLTGRLHLVAGDRGTWHFISVPEDLSGGIHAYSQVDRRGFGSVRVEAAIAAVTWRTSVFPSSRGGYFLPVKKDVCRRTGISAGDEVTVSITLL